MTASRTSDRTPDPVHRPSRTTPVSVLLRARTRSAHEATEAAFDLDARLVGLAEYRALLLRLHRVHAPLEAALAVVPGLPELVPTLDLRARRRLPLLERDLAALGVRRHVPATPGTPIGTPAQALGCLYVLEGSALGGRIVARQARAALGPDLPVAFFDGDGTRRLGRDWRQLQAVLDDAPRTLGPGAVAAVLAGAEATFAVVREALAGGADLPVAS